MSERAGGGRALLPSPRPLVGRALRAPEGVPSRGRDWLMWAVPVVGLWGFSSSTSNLVGSKLLLDEGTAEGLPLMPAGKASLLSEPAELNAS